MSIFEEGQTTDQPSTGSNEDHQQETNPLEVLVGEGKKFKSVEDLAKGKLESDQFISELQRQIKELREDINKQSYSKELLETLGKQGSSISNATPEPQQNKADTDQGETKPAVSDDLKTLVEQALSQREKEATAKQNIDKVEAHLAQSYGTEANAHVLKKAQELGLSLARMKELAAESPNAFLALIGEKPAQPTPMVQGSIRTDRVDGNGGQRDWNFYQTMRRKNPREYYTPKVQQALLEDKKRLGDRFGI